MLPSSRLLPVLSLIGLTACSNVMQQSPNSADTLALASAKPDHVAMSGLLTMTPTHLELTSCNSAQWVTVTVNNEQQLGLISAMNHQQRPVYAELIGDLTPPAKHSEALAQLVVKQINYLNPEQSTCQAPLAQTKALGNEPFWSADVLPTQIVFSRLGEETQRLPIQTQSNEAKLQRYTTSKGTLQLTSQWCSDSMSDAIYGWHAQWQQGDTRMTGCARVAQDTTDIQQWQGKYISSRASQTNETIQLVLNADHSATTYYGQTDEQITETGYWQALDKQHVDVTMTHHQRFPLIAQRIYTLTDQRLTATQEIIAGTPYPIANNGLTLTKQAVTRYPSSNQFNQAVDDAVRAYAIKTNNLANSRYRWLTYDLNNDGQNELLVQMNWCGSGGCTLLVFTPNKSQSQWQFNSKITQVRNPIYVAEQNHGWKDLLFWVSGGGQTARMTQLHFDGQRYPMNPSVAPTAQWPVTKTIHLFSDDPQLFSTGRALQHDH